MVEPFWLALQFLTRLPTPTVEYPESRRIGQSVLTYPLVGLVIGGIALLPLLFFSESSPLLLAALSLVLWVLVTGALHLDGLADSADAWLGGRGDTQRTLEIMKDPHVGVAAVVLVVLVLMVKFAALVVLVEQQKGWAVLLIPALGRASVLGLFLTTPYVRQGGLGASLAEHLPRTGSKWIVAATCSLFVLGGGAGVQSLLVGLLAAVAVRQLMLTRIGGTTGDTAGALVELTETAAILGWALAL